MDFEVTKESIQFCDVETRQVKRHSEETKNELMRDMFLTRVRNELKFDFVLMGSWFTSLDNFKFIRAKEKHFVGDLKDNRLIALSEEDKKQGRYKRVNEPDLLDNELVRCWLKGYENEILVVRRVFTNKDGESNCIFPAPSSKECVISVNGL